MQAQIDMLQPSAFQGLSLLRDFNQILLDQLPPSPHPGPGWSGAHPRFINSGSLHFHNELVVPSILFRLPLQWPQGSLCWTARASSSSRKSSCVGFPCAFPCGICTKLETFPPLKKKKKSLNTQSELTVCSTNYPGYAVRREACSPLALGTNPLWLQGRKVILT